jgi:hypothetical protein
VRDRPEGFVYHCDIIRNGGDVLNGIIMYDDRVFHFVVS